MSLNNQKIDAVLRDYDLTQAANKRKTDLRRSEVYSRVPQIKEIDDHIAEDSVNWLASSLADAESDLTALHERVTSLVKRKEELLARAGYPADYLDPVYTCSICKDTGYVGNKRCSCFMKKLSDIMFSESNLKNAVPTENFSTFNYAYFSDTVPKDRQLSPRDNIKKAVEKARNFVHNFDSEFKNLLITGNTGTGKTFLCNCIAKELLDSGHSVVYQTEYELFDALVAHTFSGSDPVVGYKYECIAECDLLVIDDMGTGFNNSLTNTEFFRILNERLLNRRSTLISTNLHFEDIQNNYSERVLSRIIGSYDFIELYGADIRKLKKISN